MTEPRIETYPPSDLFAGLQAIVARHRTPSHTAPDRGENARHPRYGRTGFHPAVLDDSLPSTDQRLVAVEIGSWDGDHFDAMTPTNPDRPGPPLALSA